jgi:hypothetical protein
VQLSLSGQPFLSQEPKHQQPDRQRHAAGRTEACSSWGRHCPLKLGSQLLLQTTAMQLGLTPAGSRVTLASEKDGQQARTARGGHGPAEPAGTAHEHAGTVGRRVLPSPSPSSTMAMQGMLQATYQPQQGISRGRGCCWGGRHSQCISMRCRSSTRVSGASQGLQSGMGSTSASRNGRQQLSGCTAWGGRLNRSGSTAACGDSSLESFVRERLLNTTANGVASSAAALVT